MLVLGGLFDACFITESFLSAALVFVRSFVALIFVVVLFFASWRFDRRGWVIRPRKPDLRKRDGA